MIAIGLLFVRLLYDCFKSRRRLEAEILVLRHQLNVLQQCAPRRAHLRWADRALLIWLYRRCPRILDAIAIVRPETVVRWHRMGFAAYWRWKSRSPGGRPRIGKEVRDLIRRMSFENPLWGAPMQTSRCARLDMRTDRSNEGGQSIRQPMHKKATDILCDVSRMALLSHLPLGSKSLPNDDMDCGRAGHLYRVP